jgi:glutathione S-transferase
MTKPLTLYYAPDNASLCVRLALLELGIPFETVLVDRAKQAQKSAAYLAVNPNGLIPTLVTEEGPIYETAAILLWLAEDDFMPHPHSDALKWMFWLANTLHPAMRMWFYPEQYIEAAAIPALSRATKARLDSLFTQLDSHAAWLDLRRPSALACYLAPMIRWAALYGPEQAWFDLSKYPKLHKFAIWFEDRPASLEASLAEGLGQTIFSAPQYPNPPEGSAL